MKRCLENVQGVLLGAMIFFLGLSLLAMPQNSLLADDPGGTSNASRDCIACTGCRGVSTPCPPGVYNCVPVGEQCDEYCDCVQYPEQKGNCWCRK